MSNCECEKDVFFEFPENNFFRKRMIDAVDFHPKFSDVCIYLKDHDFKVSGCRQPTIRLKFKYGSGLDKILLDSILNSDSSLFKKTWKKAINLEEIRVTNL